MPAAREPTTGLAAEFDKHADTAERYGGRVISEFPELQFHLVDGDEIVAQGRSLPLRGDGRIEDIPTGIDGAFERAFEEGGANVLCAVEIAVPPAFRGRGFGGRALRTLVDLAARHGLGAVVAPVKPTWKAR